MAEIVVYCKLFSDTPLSNLTKCVSLTFRFFSREDDKLDPQFHSSNCCSLVLCVRAPLVRTEPWRWRPAPLQHCYACCKPVCTVFQCAEHTFHPGSEIRDLRKRLKRLMTISWLKSYIFIGRYQFCVPCKKAGLGDFRA